MAVHCVLLSVSAFSAAADYYQPEQNAKSDYEKHYKEATQKAIKTVEARSLTETLGSVYDQNIKEINSGKRLTLGSVFQGAMTVTIAYISGGSTVYASVPSAISTSVRALGLAGSINVSSGLESAYESAISELQTRIYETSAAIARYKSAWESYSLVVQGHNSSSHGGTYSYGSAHKIDPYIPVTLNKDLPSFSCPDGSCGQSWSMPSTARTAHYARCGTSEDPYDMYLKGCSEVFYTCNSSSVSRHKPKDCGLYKWTQTTHGWTEITCLSDYRECTQNQQLHATPIISSNITSLCGAGDGSSPRTVSSNTSNNSNTSPPTDNTPNCSDCTSHCSSPCSCTNSGTCNGSVAAPPPPPETPTPSACDHSSCILYACTITGCPDGSYWSCEDHRTIDLYCSPCGVYLAKCPVGPVLFL